MCEFTHAGILMTTCVTMHTILHDTHPCVNINTSKNKKTYIEGYTSFKMPTMNKLGNNLRKAREKAGFTQAKMAELLQIQRTNYVKLETKGKFGIEIMEKIAAIPELNVSIEQLRLWKAMEQYPELEVLEDPIVQRAIEQAQGQKGKKDAG